MHLRTGLGLLVLCGLAVMGHATAPEPVWWSNGVIDTNPANPVDNWAMANVGQLKNVAMRARAHLDTTLGTTQADWNTAYAPDACPLPFSATPDPDNFAPVTVGQLKFVASGFYRLLHSKAPTYDVSARLQALGVPTTAISGSGPYFPWSATTGPGENFDAATIGQLKLAFSFDMIAMPGADFDQDGLADAWEQQYFGNVSALPNADPDGDGISNLTEYQLGLNPIAPALPDTTGAINLRVFVPRN